MVTIKWKDTELSEWQGEGSTTHGHPITVILWRALPDNAGSAIINIADANGQFGFIHTDTDTIITNKDSLRWYVGFTGKLDYLFSIFNAQNYPIYSENQTKDMQNCMDKFLIRMSGLKAFI